MISRVSLPIFITIFSFAAFAQESSSFTLRPGLAANEAVSGLTRARSVGPSGESLSAIASRLEREAFDLLNRERRENGLTLLDWSDDLAALARLHSGNMAQHNFFSHRGVDGSMVDERAERMGLTDWQSIGENIAYMRGYDDPARLAVQKWMESTAHRKNLLASNWKESAVGVAVKPDGTYYFTQVFIMRR